MKFKCSYNHLILQDKNDSMLQEELNKKLKILKTEQLTVTRLTSAKDSEH